jgi:hypothetical protein
MGQKKHVWVYSISVAQSVDVPIGHIPAYKKDLFDLVVDNGSEIKCQEDTVGSLPDYTPSLPKPTCEFYTPVPVPVPV